MPNESINQFMLGKTAPRQLMSEPQSPFSAQAPELPGAMDSRNSAAMSVDLPSFERELEKYGAWSSGDHVMYSSYWQGDIHPSHVANSSDRVSSMNGETAMEGTLGVVNQAAESLNSVWDTPPVMSGDVLPDLFNLAVKIASVSDMTGQNSVLNVDESGVFDLAAVGPLLHNSGGRTTIDFNSCVMQSTPQPVPVVPEGNNKWPVDGVPKLEVGSPLTFNSNALNVSAASKCNAMSKLGTSPCATSEPYSAGQVRDASTLSCGVDRNCAGGTPPRGTFSPSNFSGRDTMKPTCVSNNWRAVGSPSFTSPRPETPGNGSGSCDKINTKPRLSCRNLSSQWSSWPSNGDPATSHSGVLDNSGKTWWNAGTPLKDRSNSQDNNGPKPERGTPKGYKNNSMLKENCVPTNETAKNAPLSKFMNDHDDIWRQPFPSTHGANSGMQKKDSSDTALKGHDNTTERSFNNVRDENLARPVNAFLNPPTTMPNAHLNSSVNSYGFAPPCFAVGNSSNGRVLYGENFVPNVVVGGQTQAIFVPRAVDALPHADSQFQQCPGRGTNAELVSLMQELAVAQQYEVPTESTHLHSHGSPCRPSSASMDDPLSPNKGCVFCKNNGYHSTFYKSHALKDDRGCCTCPVLRTYVCPLCGASGDAAHTLKYCPYNMVTGGDPVAAGLPPGKVTNWRDVAQKMAFASKSPPRDIYWRT